MRRLVTGLALSIGILGCGSGESGGGPSGPPPTSNVPASISVEAGGAQTGEPGSVLAVKPVVTVRNAAGGGVSGVTVTFSVDSGGGTLQSTSVVTAGSGTASPGDWRLGSAEGRNVVSVTVGSLAPARLVATAAFVTRALVDSTLTDGTISVTTGALAGARLEISAGAIGGARRWTLTQESTTGWSLKEGVRATGAALRLTSTAEGLAASPMKLTLPATQVPGQKNFLVMRDPSSGALQVLNTIDQNATSITAAVTHFDGTYLGRAASSALSGRPTAARAGSAGYGAQVVVANIAVQDLDKDVDTGFRPGVDDWEFRSWPTSLEPGVPIDYGKTISSLAYFGYLRSAGSLYKKHVDMPGVELSNRNGIAAAAYAQTIADPINIGVSVTAIRNATRAGMADQMFYDVLKANLFVTQLPQLLIAGLPAPDPESPTPMKMLTAYRTVGTQIFYADPNAPGDATRSTRFNNGSFDPLTVVLGPSGKTTVASYTAATGVGTWYRMGSLALDVDQILQGGWPVVGGPGDVFPKYVLDVRAGGFLERTGSASANEVTLYLADSTRMWVTCNPCVRGLTSQVFPGKVEPFMVYRAGSSTPSSSGRDMGLLWNATAPVDETLGLVVTEHFQGTQVSWLDFVSLKVKHWVLDVTPAAPNADPGDTLSFNVTARGPTLPPHRLVWTFGDQSAAVAVASNTAARYAYKAAGNFPVKVEMRRLSDDKVIAIGRVNAVIRPPERWRLTSFTQASFTNTLPSAPKDQAVSAMETRFRMTEHELRDSLIARPGGGVIQVHAPGQAPQNFWRHVTDDYIQFFWMLPLKENTTSPTMYLTFPRGGQTMGGLLGATGAPAVVPPFGSRIPMNPTAFINQLTKTGTAPATTYDGIVASRALGSQSSLGSAPSIVTMRLEVNATTTTTGLTGTITFRTVINCGDDSAYRPCKPNPVVGELTRVHNFTAVRF